MDGKITSTMTWATIALLLLLSCNTSTGQGGGKWELLLNSSGVVAMHMALTHESTVIIFDQTTYSHSGLLLCSNDDDDDDSSCWVHSVEYNILSNTIRPLTLRSDPWCSSGAFLADGTLAQTGGYEDGYRRIRYFRACADTHCAWSESDDKLSNNRWYATNQILPDDRMFVVGGRNAFTYEFVPKFSSGEGAFKLPLLQQTYDRSEAGNNLYPIVHLSSDGNLFVFANRDSILLDYNHNRVLRTYPQMPGDGARSYPSTGSSVMLPLDHADGYHRVEIMICGGGSPGAFSSATDGEFLRSLSSCGRMVITDDEPKWSMEEMPGPRVMSDMLILPTGDILIINGAMSGSAGWGRATDPCYSPLLYQPNNAEGGRFTVLASSQIARMYHSTAIVLPDGRILVGGSNPEKKYTFSGVPYPTELRLEAFSPYYLGSSYDEMRASIFGIHHDRGMYGVKHGEEFVVRFDLATVASVVEFHLYAPPFTTHSQSMSQRMLKLECTSVGRTGNGRMRAALVAPPSPVVAPMGYYLLTVVNGGIPSIYKWMRLVHA